MMPRSNRIVIVQYMPGARHLTKPELQPGDGFISVSPRARVLLAPAPRADQRPTFDLAYHARKVAAVLVMLAAALGAGLAL